MLHPVAFVFACGLGGLNVFSLGFFASGLFMSPSLSMPWTKGGRVYRGLGEVAVLFCQDLPQLLLQTITLNRLNSLNPLVLSTIIVSGLLALLHSTRLFLISPLILSHLCPDPLDESPKNSKLVKVAAQVRDERERKQAQAVERKAVPLTAGEEEDKSEPPNSPFRSTLSLNSSTLPPPPVSRSGNAENVPGLRQRAIVSNDGVELSEIGLGSIRDAPPRLPRNMVRADNKAHQSDEEDEEDDVYDEVFDTYNT